MAVHHSLHGFPLWHVRFGISYGWFDAVDVSGPTWGCLEFVTAGPEEGRSFFRNVVFFTILVFLSCWWQWKKPWSNYVKWVITTVFTQLHCDFPTWEKPHRHSTSDCEHLYSVGLAKEKTFGKLFCCFIRLNMLKQERRKVFWVDDRRQNVDAHCTLYVCFDVTLHQFKVSLLSCPRKFRLSPDVSADAGVLCDRASVFGVHDKKRHGIVWVVLVKYDSNS
jgi:hypothetical protein